MRQDNPNIWTMTIKEFENTSNFMRFLYSLFRNPYFYLIAVPSSLVFIFFRIPDKNFLKRINLNSLILNLLLATIFVLVTYTIGLKKFLILNPPCYVGGFTIGAWLFYLQHQFEDSYFAHDQDFNFVKASLTGSYFYKFPALLNWMTGNVAYHHIHYLNSFILMYDLVEAHNDLAIKFDIKCLKLNNAFKAFKFKIRDEEKQKNGSFF
ncbi:fatty acid desaturase [Zobellia nedashkovskayae]|uniref:fatty acid desaturase n=1 Tax=Zobellia nedashkovskayae TaxID=2779510 RepID=UPI001D03CA0E|nr:fatty acid desaturase [Zobellia nedashkovskayae]